LAKLIANILWPSGLPIFKNVACKMLRGTVMSSVDSNYKKMAAALEQGGAENAPPSQKSDPARQVPRDIAHDLNNILTIIQGYADSLLLKHGKDPKLAPHLKVISEAAKRATIIVRDATPSSGGTEFVQR
jgi:nitrogen-specific signal transduction histidine kinase